METYLTPFLKDTQSNFILLPHLLHLKDSTNSEPIM